MKAIKDNKIYMINDASKTSYLSQGYDIILDNGKLEKSPKTIVSQGDYDKLMAENKKLRAENLKLKKASE
ncbi:MAG: hypothetical protein GX896_03180 [Clostridiales bacterium]|nr:hypothetical protein [Clostridiales bacterium]